MNEMKLQYLKISQEKYKFFYQNGDAYGEFYIDLEPETPARGSATLYGKDPEYAKALLDALMIALV